MPRDFIDVLTHSNHLARLQADRAAAQAKFDAAALLSATDENGKPALAAARAELQDVDDSIDALNRARVLSENAERQTEDERRAADHRAEALGIIKAGEKLKGEARKIDAELKRLIDRYRAFDDLRDSFNGRLSSITDGCPKEGLIREGLKHRLEGTIILGRLYAAGIALPDGIELDNAAREAKGNTVGGLVSGRVDRALSLASTDVPALKNPKE